MLASMAKTCQARLLRRVEARMKKLLKHAEMSRTESFDGMIDLAILACTQAFRISSKLLLPQNGTQ